MNTEYNSVEFLVSANTGSPLWGSHDEDNLQKNSIFLCLCQAVICQAGQREITQNVHG